LVTVRGSCDCGGLIQKIKTQSSSEKPKERGEIMLREGKRSMRNRSRRAYSRIERKISEVKSEFDERWIPRRTFIITTEEISKAAVEQQVSKELEQVKRKEALELDSKKEIFTAQLHSVQVKKEELERITNQRIADLEKVANQLVKKRGMDGEQCLPKRRILRLPSQIKRHSRWGKLTATKQARKNWYWIPYKKDSYRAMLWKTACPVFSSKSDDIKGKKLSVERWRYPSAGKQAYRCLKLVVDDTLKAHHYFWIWSSFGEKLQDFHLPDWYKMEEFLPESRSRS